MKLGSYELLEKLGEGGMGVVHRARGPDGAIVAVKVLKGGGLARFERERRLLASLGDAGFVPLLDMGKAGGREFLVMPFVEGGTLRSKLAKGPLGVEATLALGRALARALGAAHAKGIVHRDVKPENVLFDGEGRPLIADLGLAKHFDDTTPGASRSVVLSKTGELRGTAGYMAPEQMADAKSAGPAADVFALGAVLYECLAGVPAFMGESSMEVMSRVADGVFAPLARQCPAAPPWLVGVVERCLAPAPAKRFEDAAELERSLEPPRARVPVRAAIASILVLALGVGALVLLEHRPARPAPPVTIAAPASATVTLPAWFTRLPPASKPALPLPPGLTVGNTPGEYVNEKDGSVLVYVPGGSCRLGSDDAFSRPSHDLDVGPFWIGKYLVTRAQFARFVAATGYVTFAETDGGGLHHAARNVFRGAHDDPNQLGAELRPVPGASWQRPFPDGKEPDPRTPVVQVSWNDAREYARWAGLLLPSEDEWEKAAAWDPVTCVHRDFAWGDELPTDHAPGNFRDAAFYRHDGVDPGIELLDDGFHWLSPVGQFRDDCSPYGAFDVTGNVVQWCR